MVSIYTYKRSLLYTPKVIQHVLHYSDVIMSEMASQITGVSNVCPTTKETKHQSSASLAFVKGIHRSPVDSLHKGLVTRKMFTFDDVIMEQFFMTISMQWKILWTNMFRCVNFSKRVVLLSGLSIFCCMMTSSNFPRYWPFVRGFHRSPVNSPYKGQWRGALMFSLICIWINGWVNNREADDLRRYRPSMTSF